MFKFARYFFFIFIITTIVPLFALYAWTSYQLKTMENKRAANFIEIGAKEFQLVSKQYLKFREYELLKIVQSQEGSSDFLSRLQSLLSNSLVSPIYNSDIRTVSSNYELIKTKENKVGAIYTSIIIPIKNKDIAAISIKEPTKIAHLGIQGPFNLEFFAGNKISKETFIASVLDPLNPMNTDMNRMPPRPLPFDQKHRDFGPNTLGNLNLSQEPPHYPPIPPEEIQRDKLLQTPLNNGQSAPNPVFQDFNKIDRSIGIPKNSDVKYAKVTINDDNQQPIITVLIKECMPPKNRPPFFPEADIFNLIILTAGFLLSFIIAYFVNKNFVEPLVVLSFASKEVKQGNLDISLTTNLKQEQIVSTFENFNDMVQGLKDRQELRNSFIASLTHDLRTPLIAQSRSLSLLSGRFKALGLKDEYELAKNIEKNSSHLLRMVNLILDSYQFDSDKFRLSYSDINLKKLVNSCYEKVSSLAEEKNIEFQNCISEDFPLLRADRTAFSRVLINLISNAIENISKGDKISIFSDKTEDVIKIIVEDNGPGIAPEEAKYIFDRYYTGKGLDRKIGSGLGLDVCKKIIQLHGGTISLESELNNYTRFIIMLPNG